MKDRLITLLGAVIAFYILFRLLFPQIGIPQKELSYPTSENRGKYGLAGLEHWLQRDGLATYSLRKRYDTLDQAADIPTRGNLIIITLPLRLEVQARELKYLQNWTRQGNAVLFLVAMSDWPEWASRSMSHSVGKELENFGLEMVDQKPGDKDEKKSAADKFSGPRLQDLSSVKAVAKTRFLIPTIAHPLTAGVGKIQADWLSSEGINWHLDSMHGDRGTLVLLRDQTNQGPALWLSVFGKGRVLVSRHSGLFCNASLGLADNAALFSNIVHNLLGRQGKVIFDDMHQGLSVLYDAHAFFHDKRLHHTLLFLLALWLVYVMGHTNRFGQLHGKKPVLQLLEHIQAIGNLFARRLHSSAVALRYARHFFNEVRSYYGLIQNGEPIWNELRENTAIDETALQRAQTLYRKAQAHQHIDLIKFVNTLKTMRRKLQ